MKEMSCRTCKYIHSDRIGLEIDDEGYDRPIYEHRCDLTGKMLNVLDFSCGLWRQKP